MEGVDAAVTNITSCVSFTVISYEEIFITHIFKKKFLALQ
jgi:hypothetical protein